LTRIVANSTDTDLPFFIVAVLQAECNLKLISHCIHNCYPCYW